MADDKIAEELWAMSPDGKAIEMEGAGVVRAIDKKNIVECLVVKGVSDYSNKEKADDWQPQAATNSAQYLCEIMNKTEHLFGMVIFAIMV